MPSPDIGFIADAGVSAAVVLQTEVKTFLTFRVGRRSLSEAAVSDYGVVHVEGCILTTLGHPNDEALAGHPLYPKGLGYCGVYEVRNFLWIKRTTEINRIAFPKTSYSTPKHFIFTFHDRPHAPAAHHVA